MSTERQKQPALSRRGMLLKLGLAATAVYATPVMLKLSDAHASSFSRRSRSSSFS